MKQSRDSSSFHSEAFQFEEAQRRWGFSSIKSSFLPSGERVYFLSNGWWVVNAPDGQWDITRPEWPGRPQTYIATRPNLQESIAYIAEHEQM